MKISLLTSNNPKDYVVDEAILLKELKKHQKYEFEYTPWNADVDWSEYKTAVVRNTWDYTSRLSEFLDVLDKIENAGCRVYNDPHLIRWNSNKSYLKELEKAGVSIVPSLFPEEQSLDVAKKKIFEFREEKFILKPLVGAGSQDIRVFDKKTSLLDHLFGLPPSEVENYFLQPFQNTVFDGEISYFYFNGVFQYAIRKKPKSGDFRVQEEYGGLINKHTPSQLELDRSKAVLDQVGDTLYARVDALHKSTDWKLMELELIEPSMFFKFVPNGAKRFSDALLAGLAELES